MKFLNRPTYTKSARELIAAKRIGQPKEGYLPHERDR
jgi:hypothetical protein